MRLSLNELYGPQCVSLGDGQALYQELFPRLRDQETVELDFTGVKLVFSPFLMGSLGRLLAHFEKETLMQRLVFCHISEEQLRDVNEFIDRAERQNTEDNDRETLQSLFEEDELGDL